MISLKIYEAPVCPNLTMLVSEGVGQAPPAARAAGTLPSHDNLMNCTQSADAPPLRNGVWPLVSQCGPKPIYTLAFEISGFTALAIRDN